MTDDGHYLVIGVWRGTEHKDQIFYLDLSTPDAQVVPWITGFDAEYEFVGNEGNTFYLRTDLDAPRQRIIAADVTQPGREGWKEIVPQEDDRLLGVTLVGGRLLAHYLHDAHSRVQLYDLTGASQGEIKLAELGTVSLGAAKQSDDAIFYSFTSYLSPPSIYRYDIANGEEHAIPTTQGRFFARRLPDRAGLLYQQRWHARADVHHATERPASKTARTQPISTPTADSISRKRPRSRRRGWYG